MGKNEELRMWNEEWDGGGGGDFRFWIFDFRLGAAAPERNLERQLP
jgi:hypothetical protein